MHRLLTTAALAALLTAHTAASAQTLLSNGDYSGGPLTTDRAWANGAMNHSEWRYVHAVQYFDTIPYDPKTDPGASALRYPEFLAVFEAEFGQADENGNGVIDTDAEVCLLHRTPDGHAMGGMGLTRGELGEATRLRQSYIASRRTWTGPADWTGSGEWPIDQEYSALAGQDGVVTWDDIPGCAFMAQTAGNPAAPVTPPPPATPITPAPTPVTPGVPVTPVQPAAPCTVPSQADAIAIVFEAWQDGRLTRAEADTLNRGRFCQLDADKNGGMTEAEFVALSLSDFDRADRNGDGVLSGRREIGALANPGSPVAAGFTRQQAQDLAKLRFAILDRQPRDAQVTLEEYLAVTGEEFTRNDVNGDGALTGAEAARQPAAQ